MNEHAVAKLVLHCRSYEWVVKLAEIDRASDRHHRVPGAYARPRRLLDPRSACTMHASRRVRTTAHGTTLVEPRRSSSLLASSG